jgi:hypothetical protein
MLLRDFPLDEKARRELDKIFGSRFDHLMSQLKHYARTLQSFDVTFYNREPILDVTLDKGFTAEFSAAITYQGTLRLGALLKRIVFSDGTVAHADDIWTINYMPRGRISINLLETADLADAEMRAGPNGETIREMIRETYRCRSAAEEDYFIRRRDRVLMCHARLDTTTRTAGPAPCQHTRTRHRNE